MKTKSSLISVIVSIYIGIVGSIAYASSGEVNYVNTNSYSVVTDVAEINMQSMAIDRPEWLDHRIPADKNKRCPQFNHKFKEYKLPVQVFSYIAWRESGCNPKAINAKFDASGKVIWTLNKNGSIDRGLLQINSSWQTVTRNVCGTDLNGLLELDCNLSVAKYIMDNSKGKLLNWKINN
jgi:soluble lytic murein transglycosylase-like protein